ncbi:hypothetical protein FACS1894105_13350 [Clostridia bacterium]|nr:hypothetical protein FACS1894105_13350 [Clostridia bacterium]
MILDIFPYKSGAYDCYQIAIANVCNHFQRKYEMISLGGWCFQYNHTLDELSIGNQIRPYRRRKNNSLLTFHGIYTEDYKKETLSADIIKQYIINGVPLLIFSDLFNCNWNEAYQKYHFNHYYILIGYDGNEQFVCIDPYITERRIKCSLSELLANMTNYRIVRFTDIHASDTEYYDELISDYTYFVEKNTPQQIEKFAEGISNEFDLDKELFGYEKDLFAVPLVDNLKILSTKRKGYSNMLRYIGNCLNPQFNDYGEQAESIAKEWGEIRLQLLKMMLKNRVTKDNLLSVASAIRKLASLEEKMMYSIKTTAQLLLAQGFHEQTKIDDKKCKGCYL